MAEYDIYNEMARRTDGNIYIGVVGPVRTGKSTFIRRFMDLMVIPGMEDSWYKERLVDELPQSGSGRTIMTTQISFVPGEAVEVTLSNDVTCNIRLVDCVGYMVPGSLGDSENGQPRMVRTPWHDDEVPFAVAAETGTQKVITEHSTIGLLVTTDGTITDIPRESYEGAEERVVRELKALGKPFAVLLNSRDPDGHNAQELSRTLAAKYEVPVLPTDALHMGRSQVQEIMKAVLYEFPARSVEVTMPDWLDSLGDDHWLIQSILDQARCAMQDFTRLRDSDLLSERFAAGEYVQELRLRQILPGEGKIYAQLELEPSLFYGVLSDACGMQIQSDAQLMSIIQDLAFAKREYDRMAGALQSVRATGYGLVRPGVADLELDEPTLTRQGGRFGIRFKAKAPSYHLMRVDMSTEITPIVGGEKQAEDFLASLKERYQQDKTQLWSTEFFGKTLLDMVQEGLSAKLIQLPDATQVKMRGALARIVNEGRSNLICILF